MHLDGRGPDPQALPMPTPGLVQRALARAAGAALVLATAAAWLSLLTWSSGDPSLTHGASMPARNLLGPSGAAFSDLALQLLGFAAPIALFAPLVWGLELLVAHRVPHFRLKAAVLPFAVLALAGACSALPVFGPWPLRHGFGGILGDIVCNFAANVCSTLGPLKPRTMAGLVLGFSGLTALGCSLGLSIRDLAVRTWPSLPAMAPDRGAPRQSDLAADLRVDARVEPTLPYQRHEPAAPQGLDRLQLERRHLADSLGARFSTENDFGSSDWAEDFAERGAEFDAMTDRASREVARRFAPARPAVHQDDDYAGDPAAWIGSTASVRSEHKDASIAPNLALLTDPAGARVGRETTDAVLRGNARLLQDALADLGVIGKIRGMRAGPAVTLFEFEPARSTKPSRVFELGDDISRFMGIQGVRVGPLPGGSAIGIEIPNVQQSPVLLREILESDAFRNSSARLPIALGKTVGGDALVLDLARLPHLLIAGGAGSGKSVTLNAVVISLLMSLRPDQCRLLMIDPKMMDLSVHNGIPHLLAPVVTDRSEAVAALDWLVREMDDRYQRMAHLRVRNIEEFNDGLRGARTDSYGGGANHRMPHIVVVVDEFADLMVGGARQVEAAVQRLAQGAAAAGIHMLMATQRPSIDIITGPLRVSFPARICFKVASKVEGRTILNEAGAEQLVGRGDMLLATGSGPLLRLQGAFVSTEEAGKVAQALRRHTQGNLRAA